MIIDLFGDSICFSYSRDLKKSQMFFSSKIKTNDIAKTLRIADPLTLIRQRLALPTWYIVLYDFLVTHSNFMNISDFSENFSGINIVFFSKLELVFVESALNTTILLLEK